MKSNLKSFVIFGLASIAFLIGTFTSHGSDSVSSEDIEQRLKRSVDSVESELTTTPELAGAEAVKATTVESEVKSKENEESRKKQGGSFGGLFKGLGLGNNKPQVDPYLMMMMMNQLGGKLSTSAYDSYTQGNYDRIPSDDLGTNQIALGSNQRNEDYGGSYGGSSYGGGAASSGYGGGGGGSYGGGSSYGGSGGGYGGGDCCGKDDKLVKLLVLGALALLGFYLYLRTTTTSGRRRKKRSFDLDDNDIELIDDLDVTLDGPAWLSMIHELWQQDAVADDPSCAYHTLCRMNRIAAESGGQGTWAAHLSSVPLSYLLHHRHEAGFLGYMDASLQGKTGANCSSLFSGCSRLQ